MKLGGSFRALAVPTEQKAGWVRQPARNFEKKERTPDRPGQSVIMVPPTTLPWPQ